MLHNRQKEAIDTEQITSWFAGIPLAPKSTLEPEQTEDWKVLLVENSVITTGGCWQYQGETKDGSGWDAESEFFAHEIALMLRIGRVLFEDEHCKHDEDCALGAGTLCCNPLHISLSSSSEVLVGPSNVVREGVQLTNTHWDRFLPQTTTLDKRWVALAKEKLNSHLTVNDDGCWVPYIEPNSKGGRVQLEIRVDGQKNRAHRLAKTLQMGRILEASEELGYRFSCKAHLDGPCCNPEHLGVVGMEPLRTRRLVPEPRPGNRQPRLRGADKLPNPEYLLNLGKTGCAAYLKKQTGNVQEQRPLASPALVPELEGDCWIWTQGCGKGTLTKPYGMSQLGNTKSRQSPAPSVFYAWTRYNYPAVIPSAMCGTPYCVQPLHLLPNPTETQRRRTEQIVRRFQSNDAVAQSEAIASMKNIMSHYVKDRKFYRFR